jgi:hypothetical protein
MLLDLPLQGWCNWYVIVFGRRKEFVGLGFVLVLRWCLGGFGMGDIEWEFGNVYTTLFFNHYKLSYFFHWGFITNKYQNIYIILFLLS